jgi:ubiquinol-cytochrome c reductase cytochrome b subunit
MRSLFGKLFEWVDLRFGIREVFMPLARHPIPRGAGWLYSFGSATMTLLMLQILTGIMLALVYVPAADEAYASLEYLNYEQPLGWFLRAMHFYGSSGMVIMLLVHMTQVFLMGAYKYPREATWIVGVGLLLFTLGMAFTGQVLRWDQDAYWGVGVGAAIAGRSPGIGPQVVQLMLGGPTIAGETLSRFFALHVFVLPGLLLTFLAMHLYLVVRQGVSTPPVPGKTADEYAAEYEAEIERGEPFFPDGVMRDMVTCALTVIVVVVLAAWLGPYGPGGVPDPTLIEADPRPDWPFLWLFALAALCPPALEGPMLLGIVPLGLTLLVLVPILGGRGERSPRRRPLAVAVVLLIATTLGVFTWLGATAPWSPDMAAWSADPMPEALVRDLAPVELQGAIVMQNKNCRNCHAIGGEGGQRGPALDSVAVRLDHDELVRQVVQGGGDMPAYGRQLSSAEITTLVSFLERLRPTDEPAARDAAAAHAASAALPQ